MSAPRDPYELEPPRRRGADEADAGRRARQLRARLRRYGARPKPLGVRRARAPRSPLLQRSTVKVSFRKNLGSGEWRAHGRYIARESARPDGENRGLGFNASRDDVPVPATLSAWEKAGDPVLWKLVVSPENGARMDLRHHARGLLGAMESDLGTRLEWVAVEHDHNDHPHLHIAVRGIRDDGSRLGLPGEYLRHGIRARSEELATRALGPRTPRDHLRAREAGVRARHVGALDREIERQAGADGRVAFARQPALGSPRHQLWRRLEFLEELGLAAREGPRAWRLTADLQPALRTIQRTRDLQRALSDPEVSLTDARPQVRFTELGAGLEITGRVAGAVHDEATDRAHLLVEGTDGLLHVVPQTGGIARRRGDGGLRTGTVITLRGRGFERDGRAGVAIEAEEHGRLEELRQAAAPNTVLDREVLDLVRSRGSAAEAPEAARSRFSETWREARRERVDLLVRAGFLDEEERGRAYTLGRGAEAPVDARTQGRELTPLGQLRAQAGKPVREAPDRPGQVLRGELRAVAVDEQGRRLAVLDTGRHLAAIPTEQADLELGHEYAAESHVERDGERRRVLAWRFEDLERMRERAHER
jgi:type IV secretory pathway VirD2 relaxase